MWTLTQGWYGDRLTEPYRPKSLDQLQMLLQGAGLIGSFWQLRG